MNWTLLLCKSTLYNVHHNPSTETVLFQQLFLGGGSACNSCLLFSLENTCTCILTTLFCDPTAQNHQGVAKRTEQMVGEAGFSAYH